MTARLPRLLCLSDVPPSDSVGGSLLLYRLLQGYPPSRLLVVETSLAPAGPGRLAGVAHRRLYLGPRRLIRSRLAPLYTALLASTAALAGRRLDRLVRATRAEALVSVVHGFAWMAAADLAARHRLPLHLIIHDDWDSTCGLRQPFAGLAHRALLRAYRSAASRLCVSPSMAETYARRYGRPAEVLLPLRDMGVADPAAPAPGVAAPGGPLTFAYAGSLHTPGYARAVAALTRVLGAAGHRLIVFTPQAHALATAREAGLAEDSLRPVLPPTQLIEALRREADVLFVPMSFEPHDRQNMMAGFPSKLADYTAVGLPLLIWGPEDCSAVRWGREGPALAEVVTRHDEDALLQAVERLAADASHRRELALRALRRGNQLFAHRVVAGQFYAALRRGGQGEDGDAHRAHG